MNKSGIFPYPIKRLIAAIPTLLAIVTLAFFLMRLAPGGPFDREQRLPQQIRLNLEAAYGLDQPLLQQYFTYLGRVIRGDLGPSFRYPERSVNELIAQGLPVSATLGLCALVLALLIGVPLGLFAGSNRNRFGARVLMGVALVGIVLPAFVIAPLLALLFGVHLQWLPAAGWEQGAPQYLVLPVLALTLPLVAYIARLTRGGLLDVLGAPWLRTAQAKGLSRRAILLRHVLKPALLPVVSFLGPATAGILTGSLVIEQVFGLPGIGRYFVQGALDRDYTLVIGVTLCYAALIVALNFLVDLAYGWLDPASRRNAPAR